MKLTAIEKKVFDFYISRPLISQKTFSKIAKSCSISESKAVNCVLELIRKRKLKW